MTVFMIRVTEDDHPSIVDFSGCRGINFVVTNDLFVVKRH